MASALAIMDHPLVSELVLIAEFVAKIPLLLVVLSRRSARSVSSLTLYLELFADAINVVYFVNLMGVNPSTSIHDWAEYGSFFLQTAVLIVAKASFDVLTFWDTLGLPAVVAMVFCVVLLYYLLKQDAIRIYGDGSLPRLSLVWLLIALLLKIAAQVSQLIKTANWLIGIETKGKAPRSRTAIETLSLISSLCLAMSAARKVKQFSERQNQTMKQLYMIFFMLHVLSFIFIGLTTLMSARLPRDTTSARVAENGQEPRKISDKDQKTTMSSNGSTGHGKSEVPSTDNSEAERIEKQVQKEVHLGKKELFRYLSDEHCPVPWKVIQGTGEVNDPRIEVDPTNSFCVRLTATFETSPETIISLLINDDLRQKWEGKRDPKIGLHFKVVRQYNQQARLVYFTIPGFWPVSGRDFVILNHYELDTENGVFMELSKSIANKSYPPNKGDYVRAHLPLSGALVRAVPDSSLLCQLQYLVVVDPKGRIPSFMVKSILEKVVPGMMRRMNKIAGRTGVLDKPIEPEVVATVTPPDTEEPTAEENDALVHPEAALSEFNGANASMFVRKVLKALDNVKKLLSRIDSEKATKMLVLLGLLLLIVRAFRR